MLDGDWSEFKPAERAGLELTRKLVLEPHTLGPDSLREALKHYRPTQVSELVITVAGFAAMNRWTSALNIPQETDGAFFQKANPKVDLSTFLHPTSPKWRNYRSRVALVGDQGPAVARRPALESRAEVEKAWKAGASRAAVLSLADEAAARSAAAPAFADGPVPAWVRLLAVFPQAGTGRIASNLAARDKGNLAPRLRAAIDWAAARHDRAWYALADARARLNTLGLSDDEVFALDEGKGLSAGEAEAVAFTRKLTAAPASIADADVERLRKHFSVPEVAEIVHRVANAAFFNRVTEAAQLPVRR